MNKTKNQKEKKKKPEDYEEQAINEWGETDEHNNIPK
jgi:hypothetical protein